MALENDDVTLVLQELLNEIQPLREELEMMIDEVGSGNEELRKSQIKAIQKRKHSIENIFSQMDSIMEAEEAEEKTDAASSGGRRKTKRRRNKKKRKTKKKRRRRRKK